MAIKSYRNASTRDFAEGVASKNARRLLPIVLHPSARPGLAAIEAMTALSEFAAFPGWQLEKLKGDRASQYSIRINSQYRICFRWNGVDAEAVEIVDYH